MIDDVQHPLVTVNILSYNRKQELQTTLQKLSEQDYHNIEVIVVDNASTDGAPEMVRSLFPTVKVISLHRNIGISGWNEGFKAARGEFILVLDDDSYPDLHSISLGVKRMHENEKIGILAYKVINTRIGTVETDWLKRRASMFVGCGALIRKSVVSKIGGFNEEIFIYCHEIEYSARCYDAGYDIWYEPTLSVFHAQTMTARKNDGGDPFQSEFRFYHYLLNDSIFRIQKFSLKNVVKYLPKNLINKLIIAIKFNYLGAFFCGIVRLAVRFPVLLKSRKPLKAVVQQFYDNGNIELFDRQWFPYFTESRLYKIKLLVIKIPDHLEHIRAFIAFKLLRVCFQTRESIIGGPQKILICNLGGVGDHMIASLFFRNEPLFGPSTICYLYDKKYSQVFRDYQGRIRLLAIDTEKYCEYFINRISILRELRQTEYDVVINLGGKGRMIYHEIALLLGAPHVVQAGQEPWFQSEWLNIRLEKYYQEITKDSANYYRNVLSIVMKRTGKNVDGRTICYLSAGTKGWAANYLREQRAYDGGKKTVSVSLTGHETGNNWAVEKFEPLITALSLKYNLIVLGTGTLLMKYRKILASRKSCSDFVGQLNILESAAMIHQSDIFIGLDSDLTHIAIALEKPIIGLTSCGSQPFWFPYLATSDRVFLFQELDCFGCSWICSRMERDCIATNTVDDILSHVTRLLT